MTFAIILHMISFSLYVISIYYFRRTRSDLEELKSIRNDMEKISDQMLKDTREFLNAAQVKEAFEKDIVTPTNPIH